MQNCSVLAEQVRKFLLSSEYQRRKSDLIRTAIQKKSIEMSVVHAFNKNPSLVTGAEQQPEDVVAFARLLSEVFPESFVFDPDEYAEFAAAQSVEPKQFEMVSCKAPRQYNITLSVKEIADLYHKNVLIPDVCLKKNGVVYGCEDLAIYTSADVNRCKRISMAIQNGTYYYDDLTLVILNTQGSVDYNNSEHILTCSGNILVPDGYHRVLACVQAMMLASDKEKVQFQDCRFSATLLYISVEEMRKVISQLQSGSGINLCLRAKVNQAAAPDICDYLRDPRNGLYPKLIANIHTNTRDRGKFFPVDINDAFQYVYSSKDEKEIIENCNWLIEFLNEFALIFPEDVEDIHLSFKKRVLFRRVTIIWLMVFSKKLRDKRNSGECDDWKSILRQLLDVSWEINDNEISKSFHTLVRLTSTTYKSAEDFFETRWNEAMAHD